MLNWTNASLFSFKYEIKSLNISQCTDIGISYKIKYKFEVIVQIQQSGYRKQHSELRFITLKLPSRCYPLSVIRGCAGLNHENRY
jgi:hypothetical protein